MKKNALVLILALCPSVLLTQVIIAGEELQTTVVLEETVLLEELENGTSKEFDLNLDGCIDYRFRVFDYLDNSFCRVESIGVWGVSDDVRICADSYITVFSEGDTLFCEGESISNEPSWHDRRTLGLICYCSGGGFEGRAENDHKYLYYRDTKSNPTNFGWIEFSSSIEADENFITLHRISFSGGPTSITEPCVDVDFSEKPFSLFPNPLRGNWVRISTPMVDLWSYKILDSSGRTILEGEFDGVEQNVYIKPLPWGVYYVLLENEENRWGEILLIHND